jgi:tetratricopeptide (TPR) repeat protein
LTKEASTLQPTRRWLQEQLQAGFKAYSQNDVAAASEICRRLLNASPKLVEGHFLVGLVALQARDRKTAFSAFGSVTKLQPQHAAAWAQLARLFAQEGQINRADRALAEAVQHGADDPVVADVVGTVYQLLGDIEESGSWFQKALAAQPEHVPFMVNHANSLVYRGDTQAAEDVLARVLQKQPDNPQAHWILSGVRKAADREHVDELIRLTGNRKLHPRASAFLYYALGKELEDLQDWGAAFNAFEAGANARRTTVEYDEASERAMFAALEKIYTEQWLAQQKPGDPDTSPIFVIGQPRTGTTLVERVITAHSQVHSAGELQQFGLAIRRLSNYRQPHRFTAELVTQAQTIDVAALGKSYMSTTTKMRGSLPRFVDKLPPNYLYVPLILAALPNAKIIHLQRNPMDACFASYKQLFADAYLHSYDQKEMARHHARYLRLMDCWRTRFPGRFFDVAYEDISTNLEPNARALIDYLELPWESACLDFHKQSAAVTTASAVQVREPAHTRSIGRWRRYATQLQDMVDTLREQGVAISDN